MNRAYTDPWAREKMTRSDAQRRYHNLVEYQIRPMIADRKRSDYERTLVLKRVTSLAHRFRYESGVVAGPGTREEVVELLGPYLNPEAGYSEELRDWVKRTIQAFGATPPGED